MPTDHRAALAKIKRFDQLIAYLRDEMGWPIARDSFEDVDDLFYDFTAEELGIDSKTAAKIETIKRLRPLSPRQPWGIFFVKFEPKRLPVIALRRILSQVALKKRASANSAERAAWSVNDLLFVSNYGEGDERQISFAHFSQAEAKQDLPTLKVLGWDNFDTALHLDAVADKLTRNLAWPEDEGGVDAWRTNWRAAFDLRHREVIATSRDLSIRLAELARDIRDRINTALAIETETGPLTKLMKAFQEALVHDLDADGFADMYAQTIAYGLLSARIADPEKKTADDFAAHMRTNPFLRELMETFLKVGGRRGKAGGPGIDFDELGVSEVVELLDNANMEAVVRDFGDRNPQEDPVIHFYELFLKEYDAKKRIQRGVFYTPRPVVSFIVRSVDELLRTEFGLKDGLADTATWCEMAERHKDLKIPAGTSPDQAFVQILDPATGTGTFLVEVIDIIHKTLVAKWQAQDHVEKKIEALWNEYVPKHLLPRLHGYELLMAPYAIAHLKIGLKLYETGYHFGSEERARIYLTNALEPAHDFSGTFEFAIPALAREAQAVNEIKRNQRFTVVIGNPPYAISSANMSAQWIVSLIEDYKRGCGVENERRIAPIQDDYIKFIRLAHFHAQQTGCSLVGIISNNSYLDGLIHRAMRRRLLDDFGKVLVYDLRGSIRRGDTSTPGASDENVFDIQQGVTISFLIRPLHDIKRGVINYIAQYGSRAAKYDRLLTLSAACTPFVRQQPVAPCFFFAPKEFHLDHEWNNFVGWEDIFQEFRLGFMSGNDDLLIDHDASALEQRLRRVLDRNLDARKVAAEYSVRENYPVARMRKATFSKQKIRGCSYRPFDNRYTYYDNDVMERSLYSINQHLLRNNVALCVSRQLASLPYNHVFVTNRVTEMSLISNKTKEANRLVPLYLYDTASANLLQAGQADGRHSNIRAETLRRFADSCNLAPAEERHSELATAGPETVFTFVYAVLHSPTFRTRYASYLEIDFPRVPLPRSVDLFLILAGLGGDLIALHLLETPKLNRICITYTGPKNPDISRVGWSEDTVWIDAAATKKGQNATPGTIGFRGVPEAVWTFHIGGYQVCEKWLKDRKGRTLSDGDITHYQKILVALAETIRLMREIDEVIEQHGGWPGAFARGDASNQEPVSETADAHNVEPPSRAAEPEAPPYEAAAAEQVLRAASRTNSSGRS